MRDSGRQKQYRAEWESIDKSRGIPSEKEAQRYVDRLIQTKWWQRRWPEVRRIMVSYNPRLHGGIAYGGLSYIELGGYGRREMVLLHEVAHIVTPIRGCKPHGPAFARNLLALVRMKLGEDAESQLREGYRTAGVSLRGELHGTPERIKEGYLS